MKKRTENREQSIEKKFRMRDDSSTAFGVSECRNTQRGAVLIMAFMVMVVLLAMVVSFLYMTSIQAKGSGYDVASGQAFWVAEAGIQDVLYKLKNDAAYRNAPTTVTASIGLGSYSVTVTKDGSTYTLTSTGTVGVLNRKISQTVVVASTALSSAIHSDAASVNFNNSSGTVNGNVEAKVQVANYSGMTINGTITEGIEQINPALDFDIYKTISQAQGLYSTSALTFGGGTYTGVYYTTKSVTIGDNAVINGSIFAEGAINFTNKANNITITQANNYPALASKGSIGTNPTGPPASRIGLQNSTISGLIYADNNIALNYLKNNVTVNGTIIADNNIDIQSGSNFTINYNAGIFTPMTPGLTFSGGAVTVTPQKDWNEIVPAT